jgi:hypothetical protein
MCTESWGSLRFSRLCVQVLLFLIPQAAFVGWPSTQVPCLDQEGLCCVDIVFVADILHTHAHAILGEHNILRFHLFGRSIGNLLDGEINIIPNEGCDPDNNEEKYQR